MASFTPPPSSHLQPFTVPAPPQSDPLESLAKFRQNQIRNMQIQAAQEEMASQRNLMQVMAHAGKDPEQLWKLATTRGDILPKHLVELQKHLTETKTNLANLGDLERKQLIFDTDRYAGLLQGVTTPEGLATANAKAEKMGLFGSKRIDPIDPKNVDPDTFADSLTFHVSGLLGQAGIAERLQKAAQLRSTEGQAAASELTGQKTSQDIAKGKREQMVADIRSAPVDPAKPGVPALPAWNAILAKYPDQNLPKEPTPDYIKRLVKSTVEQQHIPKYEMEENLAALGMTGTTQWDQFLFQSARALGKTPAQLTPKEALDIQEKYKAIDQSPVMQALAETNKTLQNQVLRTQVESFLKPEQIQDVAKDLLAGRMSLDEIKALKASRTNQTSQIISAARAMARAEGKELDLFDLEQQADFRDKTLSEFSSTLVSHAGGQRLALNTMIHHADLYQEVGESLRNGTFKPGNAIYNKVAVMFGAAPPIQANLVARFLAGETGKVATGGVPAEGEINGILQSMGADASPEAIKAAGQTLMGIAAGRMIPLKALRDKARIQKYVDILDPDSHEILTRRGFDPETMKPAKQGGRAKFIVPLKSGRNGEFDTQEQADRFRRENPGLVR